MGIIDEMKTYYNERAAEYDNWYFREDKYNKGNYLNKLWFDDLKLLKDYSLSIKDHKILELAAGTGMWTQYLMQYNRIDIYDSSEEVLKINENRTGIKGNTQDIFSLDIKNPSFYDMCFFAFWLSHVPEKKINDFFAIVKRSIKKGARVVIFDSYLNKNELNCLKYEDNIQQRSLSNGKIFKVYKKYYTRTELDILGKTFFKEFHITMTPHYFFIFDGIIK